MISKLQILGLQILTLLGTLLFLQKAAHADMTVDLRGSNGRWVESESSTGSKVKVQVAHAQNGQPLFLNVLIYTPNGRSYTVGLRNLQAKDGQPATDMWLKAKNWTGLDVTYSSLMRSNRTIRIVNSNGDPLPIARKSNAQYKAQAVVGSAENIRFVL
ncbi:MAG: hypothetical protein JST80_03755 [Bdellovibrionales bacterium]|nr:hypothetical protein [Bdellovibrionales bacterium]